jgi:DHA1 family bicyclomycin/chloramphenicol resistance-like MFS transporter
VNERASHARNAAWSIKATPVSLAILLAALAMLGPFSIDTYLPAFPSIEASLDAAPIEVQQTLSVYMLAFGFMTLWHGAVSDAFGRRNVILVSLAVFSIASLGCAAVHSIEYLWAFRILQGLSAGAGIVVGRAMIRDLYSGAAAARLLSLVTMIFSIAPAIAPILGGWIVTLANWRTIFLLLCALAVTLLVVCYRSLPETLPVAGRRPFSPELLARSYYRVFSSPLFQLKAGSVAFIFAGLFLYVASAPMLITQHLQLGPGQFGWQFIPTVAGIFLGALTANRLAGRITVSRHVHFGFVLIVGAALGNVLYHAILPPALPWTVLPLFFYAFGMSVVLPVITLLIMDLYPEMRGLVASCQSFTQMMLAAWVGGILSPMLSYDVFTLAAGQLACALIALGLWFAGRSYHYARERRNVNAWETVAE